jgi:glycosyltransferase involved in cell wall biosynthesis
LIHAYQALPIALQQHYPLVLVGNKGWLYEALLQVIQASHPSPVLLLRYVDEQTLFHLYSGAKAFVYPSLYEGFGLPVLEAMQSGLPVITSNVSSLPEVCGDAGILIDPQDESALAAAMQTLLTLEEPRYQEWAQRSLTQAKKFSWENFAHKLFATYQSINSIPSPAGGRRWP